MELLGFMVLLLIVLAAIPSSSSDRDERRSPREGHRDNYHRRSHYRPYYDEDDDDGPPYYPNPYWPPPYPYDAPYRRRRETSFIALVRAFFAGIVAISLIAVGVYYQYRKDSVPPAPTIDTGVKTGGIGPREAPPKVPAKPAKAYEAQLNPHAIRLGITDSLTFRNIQKTYPNRKIEAIVTDDNRYWVCIFAMTTDELDETATLLRIREDDLNEHGLGVVYYATAEICSGNMIREKGTDIWFCQE